MEIAWHVLLILFLTFIQGEPCMEYGCPGRSQYEPFVPAPPGHAPSCAPPGQTFCETVNHYPRQLIKFLVDKCSFDFSTALLDESRMDFNARSSTPNYNQGYNYPRQDDPQLYPPIPSTQLPLGEQKPAPVYGPPINSTFQYSYKYSVPMQSQRDPLLPEVAVKYHQDLQRPVDHGYSQELLNMFGPNQSWLATRYLRSNKIIPHTYRMNPLLVHTKLKDARMRRQSNPDIISLCPTEAQYIAPRAALNNQGNWMYIVNLPGQNDRYTQLVRSEKCLNDECNGICSIPEGYTSRCQQQYVQKRLIALEGSGNRLYNDIFWLPHGCSCQIVPTY